MEIKNLHREIMDTERIAERGRIILDLNEQLQQAHKEIEQLRALNAELHNQLAQKITEAQATPS